MIVADETVSKALHYLSEDPHPVANAQKAVLFAEKAREETFAKIYLTTEGTVKERECTVQLDPVYQAARVTEIDAEVELLRHKTRSNAADRLISVWQSENKNIRAAEGIR